MASDDLRDVSPIHRQEIRRRGQQPRETRISSPIEAAVQRSVQASLQRTLGLQPRSQPHAQLLYHRRVSSFFQGHHSAALICCT